MEPIIVTTTEALENLIAKVLDEHLYKFQNTSTGTNPQPEIIDTGTLCNRLNITEPTAIRQRKKGLIPFLQLEVL